MKHFYTKQELFEAIPRLTSVLLMSFVEAEVIQPVHSKKGPVFRQIDIVRIELACDLSEQFELQGDALGMVLSLVDGLHGVRAELKAVLRAIEEEEPEIRNRLSARLLNLRSGAVSDPR
jgi:chaperone modulatory protein CbpM